MSYKKLSLYFLTGLIAFLNARLIWAADGSGSGALDQLISKIEGLLNSVISLLFVLATVYFLWGVVNYVVGAGGDIKKLEQGKQHMLWGIVGMAIMLSAWGIVRAIQNTIFQ